MVYLAVVKTRAVVIKAQDYKERDKLVWMYTQNYGKITSIVKGAKGSKSRFLSITLPLCYGDYVLFKGKSLYNLQEGKIINSFQSLLDNLEKLTFSTYLCEIIDIACEENEPNPALFKNLISTMYFLDTDAIDYEILIRAFEIKLLKATGYDIELEKCSICGKRLNTSTYIDLQHFGGVCSECEKRNGTFISKAAYNALRCIKNMPMDKLYRLTLDEKIKKELERVNMYFIENNYTRKPKSLEMLKFMKE